MTRPRIVLADYHDEMRDRIVSLLEVDCEVVGSVADGRALLNAEAELMPEICVIDISRSVIDGLDAASKIKERGSNSQVVFLTIFDDPDYLRAAQKTGALGYVLKSRIASDLRLAITEALAGRRFVSPSLTLKSAETPPSHNPGMPNK